MPSIAAYIQQILELAPQYSKDSTPAMNQRARLCDDLAKRLGDALVDMADKSGLAEQDLEVDRGGQQGYASPFPWVRIYSKHNAPSAQAGIYLVYLFAADGSRAYLSLMQGTSVPKPSGGARVTTDRSRLLSRAAEARNKLGDLIKADTAMPEVAAMDLAWQGLKSTDSRNRARAYEAANILAREYTAGRIPPDERLLSELAGMLRLLARLHGISSPPEMGSMKESAFDAESLRRLAVTAHNLEIDQQVYRSIVAAVNSGKHVVLTGPPGTAKTTLAEVTCSLAAQAGLCSGYTLTTATADWTTYETIGGLRPIGSGANLEFHGGLFLEAISGHRWLVIDELNRSNFDRAFGQLFTVLSRQAVVLPYEDPASRNRIVLSPEGAVGQYNAEEYAILAIPKTWRIVATMNVFDKSLLFEMSFALMRRFAFIEVPSPSFRVFEELWRRELEGLSDGQLNRIHVILQGFLELSAVKDIGPAVFIDMARFSRQYLEDDETASTQELAFQLFYAYLLPQFEGIIQQQGEELFRRVSSLVGDRNLNRLRNTLNQVLGLTLQYKRLPAEDDTDGEAGYHSLESNYVQPGEE